MTTSAERMRALRARRRRGPRRLTIDVSEHDIQAIAERGYEGAVSTDHDQHATVFLGPQCGPMAQHGNPGITYVFERHSFNRSSTRRRRLDRVGHK
jgi:hypothetical protein